LVLTPYPFLNSSSPNEQNVSFNICAAVVCALFNVVGLDIVLISKAQENTFPSILSSNKPSTVVANHFLSPRHTRPNSNGPRSTFFLHQTDEYSKLLVVLDAHSVTQVGDIGAWPLVS
jgi:hypothetical protein